MCTESLTASDFARYPVWVWDDGKDKQCPIDDVEIDPAQYDTLFIRATFSTHGHKLKGYLIGDGESFYAFGIFVDGEELIFNLNLPDLMAEEQAKLYRFLGGRAVELFPLRYESDVRLKGIPSVAGEFVVTHTLRSRG
jgi:hypothetical protein